MCNTTISGTAHEPFDPNVELTERGKEILAIECANFKWTNPLFSEPEDKKHHSPLSIVKEWIGGLVSPSSY